MFIFQYGSNTSSVRLNSRDRLNGDAVDLGLVRTVENFTLSFDVWSDSNHCAASNIRPGGSSPAWGVLYEVPDELVIRGARSDRKCLDQIEGSKYERRLIKIADPSGAPITRVVCTYTVKNPVDGLLTNAGYVSHILRGLQEHSAPADYLRRVKEIALANNPDIAGSITNF